MDALKDRMAEVAAAVEAVLGELLPPGEGASQARLHSAMRFAVLGGGKRLRPFLTVAASDLFGAPRPPALRVGAAIELVHAYSLAHDDLPAMDDAALRRGRPTVHKAFGEATAILAGDALQALAFEVLAVEGWGPDAGVRATLVAGLARAAGPAGMCGGQMIDLLAEGRCLSYAETEELQALKTGAIIAFAAEAGAILAGAEPRARTRLRDFGALLGLAFQVRDDLLDAAGDTAAIGKDAGRDAAAGKATFLRHTGVEGAEALLRELRERAFACLDIFGGHATVLCQLFDFAVSRTY